MFLFFVNNARLLSVSSLPNPPPTDAPGDGLGKTGRACSPCQDAGTVVADSVMDDGAKIGSSKLYCMIGDEVGATLVLCIDGVGNTDGGEDVVDARTGKDDGADI